MATNPLAPVNAAKLASAVYAGLSSDDMDEYRQLTATRTPAGFAPVGNLIRAKTGTRRVSNFAVVMDRETSGGLDKVVTIRGTEFVSKQDWLTNLNVGVTPGPSAWPCHTGFCQTYRSMIQEIREAIGEVPRPVHVVGHSLGGAIASLTAVDLHMRGHDAYLYTFGAPRVGPLGFTYDLSRRLRGKIHRVFDRGDPVPMIPLFPFLHAPISDTAYCVGGVRDTIAVKFHDMDKNYIPICGSVTGWGGLADMGAAAQLEFGPAYWLQQAGEHSRIPGAAMGLWALGKALEAILEAAGMLLQSVFSTALTVIDTLAYLLTRAIQFSKQLKDWVMDWITTVLRWLGRSASSAADATTAFLRYVLNLLFRHLALAARQAVELVRGY